MQLLLLLTFLLGRGTSENHPPACRQLSRKDRTIAGVVVGAATLEQVQRRLGPARVQSSGEGHQFLQLVCYRSPDVGDDTVLMVGNVNDERRDTRVTSVFLGPVGRSRTDLKVCTKARQISRALRFGTGPSSGTTVEVAAQWLGVTPSQAEAGCHQELAPAGADEASLSEQGTPATCVHSPTDSAIAVDPDHTTFVAVSLLCKGPSVVAFALDWSDFGP